jgi:hypothetical protein
MVEPSEGPFEADQAARALTQAKLEEELSRLFGKGPGFAAVVGGLAIAAAFFLRSPRTPKLAASAPATVAAGVTGPS